jgi:hypothetical protein
MAKITRALRFMKKAEAALLSSIEVYNRPTFAYREETFAILALNAWELLLKAKLLEQHKNNAHCLYTLEPKKIKGGKQSKKLYIKEIVQVLLLPTVYGKLFLSWKTKPQ